MPRYPQARMSSKQAQSALAQLLYGCADERLRGFTVAGLVAAYNVPVATVEKMLAQARARRGLAA